MRTFKPSYPPSQLILEAVYHEINIFQSSARRLPRPGTGATGGKPA